MEIIGIKGILPSEKVSNQQILEIVEDRSKKEFKGDLPRTLTIIEKLLNNNGTEFRHWLTEDESPMTLIKTAFAAALKQSNIDKQDIDLLIYSSINRGFIEPANSNFITKALGLTCRNYDIVDACMGWVTSMDLINDKMKAGTIRYAVIINMELGARTEGGPFARNFTLRSAAELNHKVATFTLGEAFTATLLSCHSPDNFKFRFNSRPDLSYLCRINLPGWRFFCDEPDVAHIESAEESYLFTSYGERMHKEGIKETTRMLSTFFSDSNNVDCIFTHTSSPKTNELILRPFGVAEKNHRVGHKTGNIATASLPYGIADAIEQGVVSRGQDCLGCTGSAGMVFSTMAFSL